jgi:hypothetical protein
MLAMHVRLLSVLVFALACGSQETPSPTRDQAPPPEEPEEPEDAPRIELTAASDGTTTIAGQILVEGVNSAIRAAAPAIGICASDATERSIVLEQLAVHIVIAYDRSLSGVSIEPEGDAELLACVERAMRAQDYPQPNGPMVHVAVAPGEDASRYMIANAHATYTFTAR